MIDSIRVGRYDESADRYPAGALGTWAMNRCATFLQKDELVSVLNRKLHTESPQEHSYVFKYFWGELLQLTKAAPKCVVHAVKAQLKAGNKAFYEKVAAEKGLFGNSEWADQFKQEMDAFQEQEPSVEAFDDKDLPF